MALYHDSELQKEALSLALRSIRAGDLRFTFCLRNFPEDRRVRPIALEVLPHATGQELDHLIKTLGTLGGPGSSTARRRRFRRALRRRDDVARVLAGALLRLRSTSRERGAIPRLAAAQPRLARATACRERASECVEPAPQDRRDGSARGADTADPPRAGLGSRIHHGRCSLGSWRRIPSVACACRESPSGSAGLPGRALAQRSRIRHDGPRYLAEILGLDSAIGPRPTTAWSLPGSSVARFQNRSCSASPRPASLPEPLHSLAHHRPAADAIP